MANSKTLKKVSATKVRTGEVRLSYANVFKPKKISEDSDPKYSVALLIPKEDTETVQAIKDAIEAAKQEGSAKLQGAKKIKTPLKDGDHEDYKDDKPYHGHYVINANASESNPPQVVKRQDGMIMAADEKDVYSGCYGCATVSFYAYNVGVNKGVAAGLGNIIKLRDGERLAGGATAEQDFSDLSDDVFDDEDELL